MMTGPFDRTGRVAVVTSANSGIGLGMARLVAVGAKIAVVGRGARKNQAAAANVAEPDGQAMAMEVDVVQEDDSLRQGQRPLRQARQALSHQPFY
jgi:NAD(P)-dependent dehydrogenase (short-subunit alcohol dehydrogenase family)